MEAPADCGSACLQGEQYPRENKKGTDHTGGVRQAMHALLVLRIIAVRRETHHFERQHRKYARHQVENEATQHGEQKYCQKWRVGIGARITTGTTRSSHHTAELVRVHA